MSAPQTLLVATDFSEPATAALDRAVDLARAFDADLHIAHAFTLATPMVSAYEFGIPEDELQRAREAAGRKLEACAAEVAARDVRAHTHLLTAPADGAITHLASQIDSDWIIVGTHGHTGLTHVLLGSVAERIVRHAPCSVLVTRPPSSSN